MSKLESEPRENLNSPEVHRERSLLRKEGLQRLEHIKVQFDLLSLNTENMVKLRRVCNVLKELEH